jgi:hypothetical protein
MDSATEFLFGHDVGTLSAGLPYPASSPIANSDEFLNHPSNKFTHAFEAGQRFSSFRSGYGSIWPLAELWENKVKPYREIVDQFIEPVLVEALARRAAITKEPSADRKLVDTKGETLLSHLISHTQGFYHSPLSYLKCIYLSPSDTQVIKDEVTLDHYPMVKSC